ncbi:hypothetical protein FRC07_001489 [Ceratobasidium sp. 392]|nr:hypothetical protein FRC07_001489 [Ceratobasidium sp. 392]
MSNQFARQFSLPQSPKHTLDDLCDDPAPHETGCFSDTGSHDESDFDPDGIEDLFARTLDETHPASAPAPEDNEDESNSENDWETESESVNSNPEWLPFPSKAMYLAETICSSRRVHFGRRHVEIMLEYARQTQGEPIPSYYALREFRKSLKSRIGDPSKRYVSPGGTVFYVNEISEGIKQDISNPQVRPHMNFFPHVDGKHMSQAWHGHKMVYDVPDRFLTPCMSYGKKLFYVNELVRREHDWFIPLRWITVGPDREPHAVGHIVRNTQTGLIVHRAERKTVKVSSFLESYCELETRRAVPVFDENSSDFRSAMPNPLRKVAGSRKIYSVPLIVFMDDASGNVSKQWNKHWSCYLSNAALPREELQSEYNVRFVSTSPHATPSELMQGIRASIEKAFENPVVAYDCVTKEEVLVRPFPLFWAGDNPMQAEHCGRDEYKQSLEGYRSLFKTGNRRVASDTRRLVDERLDMAILPRTIQKVKNAARDTGVKDSLAQTVVERLLNLGKFLRNPPAGTPRQTPQEIERILQQELQLARETHCVNPLLSMSGVDIHRDTPTEILHTVLLGVVKYYWGQSTFVLEKAKKLSMLECRLASVNISGLSLPKVPARYICHYRGSLIGKHFKAIVQLMTFTCYDLLPAPLFDAWLLLGRLSSLLWYTEIDNIKTYTEELQAVIDDFLLATAQCSPSIIILKPKFHFLLHLPAYIKRFGPALLFSTERFESFNGVFRAASTFSNRQAPSRDIARHLGDLERMKHVSSGGYWQEGDRWVRASEQVLNFASTNKLFRELIGFPNRNNAVPGSIRPLPQKSAESRLRSIPLPWARFSDNSAIFGDNTAPNGGNGLYFHVLSTISHSGDKIEVGADILTRNDQFGHIQAIFGCVSGDDKLTYFIAIRLYTLNPTMHPLLDMPVASWNESVCILPVTSILCIVNVQHDCATHGACTNVQVVCDVQEREETTKTHYQVQHSGHNGYIIHLHTLHNARLIRQALPSHLCTRRTNLTPCADDIFQSAVEKLSVAKLKKSRLASAKKAALGLVTKALENEVDEADDAGDDEATPLEVNFDIGVSRTRAEKGKKRQASTTTASGSGSSRPKRRK